MSERLNERIASAREMFRALDSNGTEPIGEIAKRRFCIQERLAN